SFEEALVIAEAIASEAGGAGRMRRLTLFEFLKRSPDSSLSRTLVTSSGKYGLTRGSYKAEFIELTPLGARAASVDGGTRERVRARLSLAVESQPPFKSLYETFVSNKLPSQSVMRDHLRAALALSDGSAQEAVELFIVNAKFVRILQPMAGTERILSIDHV